MTKMTVDTREFEKNMKKLSRNVDRIGDMSFELTVSGTEEEIEDQLNQYLEKQIAPQLKDELVKGLK